MKVHWSFWVISIFMLVWNFMGCANFIMQMDPEVISAYREAEQAIIQDRPLWATLGFAISVFGGALGCVLLLLKRHVAFYVFVISLVGTVAAVAHSLLIGINYGVGEIIGIIVMPVAIAIFLVWYSMFAKYRGWVS